MKRMKSMTKAPMLAALMCIALLIVSLFLPYMRVAEELTEVAEAMEMDASPSLYGFAMTYLEKGVNAVALLLGIMGGLAVLAALLTALRKPIGTILLTLPIAAEATLIHVIFSGDMAAYEWAIGDRLIFAACGGMLLSGIWMAVKKSAAKKRRAQRGPVPAQA